MTARSLQRVSVCHGTLYLSKINDSLGYTFWVYSCNTKQAVSVQSCLQKYHQLFRAQERFDKAVAS